MAAANLPISAAQVPTPFEQTPSHFLKPHDKGVLNVWQGVRLKFLLQVPYSSHVMSPVGTHVALLRLRNVLSSSGAATRGARLHVDNFARR